MSIIYIRALDHYSRIAEEATELRREADRIKRCARRREMLAAIACHLLVLAGLPAIFLAAAGLLGWTP